MTTAKIVHLGFPLIKNWTNIKFTISSDFRWESDSFRRHLEDMSMLDGIAYLQILNEYKIKLSIGSCFDPMEIIHQTFGLLSRKLDSTIFVEIPSLDTVSVRTFQWLNKIHTTSDGAPKYKILGSHNPHEH